MPVGLIYFLVIVIANSVGAISGMGGGVIIKPVLDTIGAHDVDAISFYSSVAVFVMSIVSTYRQIKNGIQVDWKMVLWISLSAIAGGFLGNLTFQALLANLGNENQVLMIQIVLTIITLVFAFVYNRYDLPSYHFNHVFGYIICGLILGFLASLLGIGGGPINVSLIMLMFSVPIKEATVYSICTIFFSQLSKLLTIAFTTGFGAYDLSLLWYIIPAAILGGLIGSKLSGVLSSEKVNLVFQGVVLLVIAINLYNAWQILV